MNILEVKNLNLGFNTEQGFLKALHGVSFNIKQGKTHALVGESGCGKTISAMSIMQLLPKNALIESGEILFQGANLLKLNSKQLQKIRGAQIALIPQDPMTSLNPLYTIENQILEVIKLHQNLKGHAAKQKALEALEIVQIPNAKERLKSYPHEFSGGMKQRAIIAMALACNAKLIIADEPTTALDVTIQAQIMELLKNIQQEFQTSILLITHDLGLVYQNAQEVSVMYSGEIVENALSEEFFKAPNHPYSQALLEALPSSSDKKLAIIKGKPPSIYQQISGCKFHPRCQLCIEACLQTHPPLKEISPNHFSACLVN